MRFPPHFLDEIRARLPVSDVVGRRVRLKKQGREWAGLSPFNQEKTASFFVNDHKGFYHDFSSGKHGDIFDFVMETQGLSFPETVEFLAGMAGIPMPVISAEDVARTERRAGLHDVMDMAAQFFEEMLRGRAAVAARAYIEKRGLSAATLQEFRIGYAPSDRFSLKKYLQGKGIPLDDMIECGMLIAGEDIKEPYDRFRDRIMFPIHDARGRIIAFGGRALSADAPAKYLNSPETPLFHKGHVVFNHHRARAAAQSAGTVMVAEGYMDVIALHVAGFRHAVAPLGTALTVEQLELLWKMGDEPILCFDGDKAGQRAAQRAIDISLPHLKPGRSLRFAFLPNGQDPDDLLRASGRGAMEDVLAKALPLVDVLWSREVEAHSFDTPERFAALEKRIRDLVASIADENVRKHYFSSMEQRIYALGRQGRDGGKSYGGGSSGSQRGGGRGGARRGGAEPNIAAPLPPPTASLRSSGMLNGGRVDPSEVALVMAAVHHPLLVERYAEEFAVIEFTYPVLDHLRRGLLDLVSEEGNMVLTSAQAVDTLEHRGYGEALARAREALRPNIAWAQPQADEATVAVSFINTLALHLKKHSLNKELQAAEFSLAQEFTEENFERLKAIQLQLHAFGAEGADDGADATSPRSMLP